MMDSRARLLLPLLLVTGFDTVIISSAVARFRVPHQIRRVYTTSVTPVTSVPNADVTGPCAAAPLARPAHHSRFGSSKTTVRPWQTRIRRIPY